MSEATLTDRQRHVLRALVAAYVAAAAPVGSATLSSLLSVRLSSASVRNTLAELTGLGLIKKPHASSGRVPTTEGIRLFVDRLLNLAEVTQYERRSIDRSFDDIHADDAVQLASRLLSDHTHQLGFVVAPRIERIALRQVSFVRLASDRVLAVLVDTHGQAHQRVIEGPLVGMQVDQVDLDRMSAALNERIVGRTLPEARNLLRSEVRSLRNRASRLLERALQLGLLAAEAALESHDPGDLVIATRLALLEQPEFSDPERLRELFTALERDERLVDLLEELLEGEGVSVSLGDELDTHGLGGCAMVAAPYGDSAGMLGVIGPARMDYGRIIPLVDYCSQMVTDKLSS
ncbi:MAG: heat-inducible transcriptional repressor HrcA [Myxococcota bacterium]|nr:heat-inducible transcriptional repressor HrcA [Myxococcota bacterium]